MTELEVQIEGGTTSEASSVYEGLNAAEEANEALSENLRQEWQSMYERNEACNAVCRFTKLFLSLSHPSRWAVVQPC